ncbi:MAG TPA: hypothetical protein VNH39_06760 [Steroidobacteraceae bacterium]|nr:hypothetical protein [Steroidobacteraceae bacterium]
MAELFIVNDSDEVKVLQGPQVAPPEVPRPVRVRPPRKETIERPWSPEPQWLQQIAPPEVKALQGPYKAEAVRQDYTKDFRKFADKLKLDDAARRELSDLLKQKLGVGALDG